MMLCCGLLFDSNSSFIVLFIRNPSAPPYSPMLPDHIHVKTRNVTIKRTNTSNNYAIVHTWALCFSRWIQNVQQGRRTRGGCECFNTHTFPGERVQHPHFFPFFRSFAQTPYSSRSPFLWPLCVCLLSPPLPLKHDTGFECDRLMIGCSALSLASLRVLFIGQLVLRRRELMVMVISVGKVTLEM